MDDDEPDANGAQIIGWTFHKCLVADSAKNGIESIRLRLATDTKYRKYTAKNRDCVMTDEEIDKFWILTFLDSLILCLIRHLQEMNSSFSPHFSGT